MASHPGVTVQWTLDLTDLPDGKYFLRVETGSDRTGERHFFERSNCSRPGYAGTKAVLLRSVGSPFMCQLIFREGPHDKPVATWEYKFEEAQQTLGEPTDVTPYVREWKASRMVRAAWQGPTTRAGRGSPSPPPRPQAPFSPNARRSISPKQEVPSNSGKLRALEARVQELESRPQKELEERLLGKFEALQANFSELVRALKPQEIDSQLPVEDLIFEIYKTTKDGRTLQGNTAMRVGKCEEEICGWKDQVLSDVSAWRDQVSTDLQTRLNSLGDSLDKLTKEASSDKTDILGQIGAVQSSQEGLAANIKSLQEEVAPAIQQTATRASELAAKTEETLKTLEDTMNKELAALRIELQDLSYKHSKELQSAHNATEKIDSREGEPKEELASMRVELDKFINEYSKHKEEPWRAELKAATETTRAELRSKQTELSEKMEAQLEKLKIEHYENEEELDSLKKDIEGKHRDLLKDVERKHRDLLKDVEELMDKVAKLEQLGSQVDLANKSLDKDVKNLLQGRLYELSQDLDALWQDMNKLNAAKSSNDDFDAAQFEDMSRRLCLVEKSIKEAQVAPPTVPTASPATQQPGVRAPPAAPPATPSPSALQVPQAAAPAASERPRLSAPARGVPAAAAASSPSSFSAAAAAAAAAAPPRAAAPPAATTAGPTPVVPPPTMSPAMEVNLSAASAARDTTPLPLRSPRALSPYSRAGKWVRSS